MLETNIRIVRPGWNLHLWIKKAVVDGADLSVDLLQRACGRLRRGYGLAAVPAPESRGILWVTTTDPIPSFSLEEEHWTLTVQDAGEGSRKIFVRDGTTSAVITELIGRAFTAQLAYTSRLWTLDSPRIWYEPQPFQREDGIAAFRRFEISSVFIDGVGVGVAVDVGTAFFTEETLAYFFDEEIDQHEQTERRERFIDITRRQAGQKGTLLYNNGRSRTKCYFEEAPEGVTCEKTGRVRVKGKTYASVYAYYQEEFPGLPVLPESKAIRVSFKGIARPQYVAAEFLRARVMNDNVTGELSQVDKLDPQDRREILQDFWRQREPHPLGRVAPGFYEAFWQPDEPRITEFPLTELEFGNNQSLPCVQSSAAITEYREHYRQRLEFLENVGCYFVPPTVNRELYCAYPWNLREEAAQLVARDIADKISKWTKVKFTLHPIRYNTVREAIDQLRSATNAGMVVFVLNEEPGAYYEVASQLPSWRVKRLTRYEVTRHFGYFTKGLWHGRRRCHSLERGQARWERFLALNALDVLQQLDCVPWRAQQLGPYDAQVAIDVGHDRRYFALSLMISRGKEHNPSLVVDSFAVPKLDHQHERINGTVLSEHLIELLKRVLHGNFTALSSLLIVRDGLVAESEQNGIYQQAIPALRKQGLLTADARVDLVELRKKSLIAVRLWERNGHQIQNAREGTAVQLTEDMVIVTSTGAATLHQGTAQPFVVVRNGRHRHVLDAAQAAFDAAQLNFSSPTVAQRDPLTLKRTDDELIARAAQEIKGLR
jgi:hypothetical protein